MQIYLSNLCLLSPHPLFPALPSHIPPRPPRRNKPTHHPREKPRQPTTCISHIPHPLNKKLFTHPTPNPIPKAYFPRHRPSTSSSANSTIPFTPAFIRIKLCEKSSLPCAEPEELNCEMRITHCSSPRATASRGV